MKVKKVLNLNLLDTCVTLIDTCVPHEIRDEQTLIGGHRWCRKKRCPLFQKLVNISLIFENVLLLFIPIFEVVNVSGRHQDHFGQRKERNDVKLLQLEVF